MKLLLLLLFLLLVLAFLPFMFRKKGKRINNDLPNFIKIGHRGAAGYCPENTMASFRKAAEMGADFLEIDVQLTKDGKFVVIHDPTVDRTTNGKGKVSSYTLEELQQLDAGSWFHSNFSGERIPSFAEVLQEFGSRIGLLVEVKNPAIHPGIEEKLVEELKKYNLHELPNNQVIIQSFDKESMKRLHQLLPSIPVGILMKYHPRGIRNKDIQEVAQYAQYLNPKLPLVNRMLINRIHEAGLKVCPWTVRTTKEANRLKTLPVDGIITDFLDYL